MATRTRPPKAVNEAEKPAIEVPTSHKVKYDDIKEGDLHAFIYWGKIKRKTPGYYNKDESATTVECVDKVGLNTFGVNGLSLNEASYSADQFHEERKASMTEVAEILVRSFNIPFTVCFLKQEGEERVLRGRLIAPEPLLGRSHVEDLDIEGPPASRFRLVDHRGLKWLIVNGIKYIVGRKK